MFPARKGREREEKRGRIGRLKRVEISRKGVENEGRDGADKSDPEGAFTPNLSSAVGTRRGTGKFRGAIAIRTADGNKNSARRYPGGRRVTRGGCKLQADVCTRAECRRHSGGGERARTVGIRDVSPVLDRVLSFSSSCPRSILVEENVKGMYTKFSSYAWLVVLAEYL